MGSWCLTVRKKNLRKLAKGKPCQVRIPHHCSFDDSTTVLAHIRRGGVAGMGQKPPDLCGVWACHRCHDIIDGRVSYPYEDLERHMLEGLCRTLAAVSKEINV